MSQFKPMLAATLEDPESIKYPVLVSPKIDGIRCVILDGNPVSRKLKPIENRYVSHMLSGLPPLDGELIVGEPTSKNGFDVSQSGIMSHDGEPAFTYLVFDIAAQDYPSIPFDERLARAHRYVRELGKPFVKPLIHYTAHSYEQLKEWENHFVASGYEGLMIRDPRGAYKHGRSTLREGGLIKMIRRTTAEGIVVGFVEKQHNANEQERDALGHAKRSKKKAGMVPAGTLGALKCIWLDAAKYDENVEFEVGTGFTDAERQHIWDHQSEYLSKLNTFEFRELTKDGAPRFPSSKGFRHVDDLGAVDDELSARILKFTGRAA